MIPNFVKRLREEIILFLNDSQNYPEFKKMQQLQNLVSFTNFEYPPNTLTFVGGKYMIYRFIYLSFNVRVYLRHGNIHGYVDWLYE